MSPWAHPQPKVGDVQPYIKDQVMIGDVQDEVGEVIKWDQDVHLNIPKHDSQHGAVIEVTDLSLIRKHKPS